MGQLDSMLLDQAQAAAASAADSMRILHTQCGSKKDGLCESNYSAPVSAMKSGALLLKPARRSCRCRLARLFNISATVQGKLDDAAAGVLFGDSEQNVLNLASSLPSVLHGTGRVATELERFARRCVAAAVGVAATD